MCSTDVSMDLALYGSVFYTTTGARMCLRCVTGDVPKTDDEKAARLFNNTGWRAAVERRYPRATCKSDK